MKKYLNKIVTTTILDQERSKVVFINSGSTNGLRILFLQKKTMFAITLTAFLFFHTFRILLYQTYKYLILVILKMKNKNVL